MTSKSTDEKKPTAVGGQGNRMPISLEMERAGVDVMWADRPDPPRAEVARDVFSEMLQVALESPALRRRYLALFSQ